MSMSRLFRFVVIRAVAFGALGTALLQWLNVPGDDDGLGTGLVAFLVMVLVALGWGVVDGFRSGFLASLLTWLLTGLLGSVAIVLVATLVNGDGVPDDLVSSSVFFAVLIAVPAFVGSALGGLGHLVRRKPAPEPAVPVA